MKFMRFYIFAILFVFVLSACSGGGGAATRPADDASAPVATVPPEYAGKTNPLAGNASAADTGKQLFATNCASCHGPQAKGDGPAAQSLNPHPKDLAAEMGALQDDYVFWRVSEGGMMAPFHSAMPAWKTIIKEEQIWQIIAFLRTLQP